MWNSFEGGNALGLAHRLVSIVLAMRVTVLCMQVVWWWPLVAAGSFQLTRFAQNSSASTWAAATLGLTLNINPARVISPSTHSGLSIAWAVSALSHSGLTWDSLFRIIGYDWR